MLLPEGRVLVLGKANTSLGRKEGERVCGLCVLCVCAYMSDCVCVCVFGSEFF